MERQNKFYKVESKFIPAKVIMFCYYATKYTMISFLVIFLTSFGLNAQQAGIITGLRSAVQAFGGLILGWLVDYTKKRKLVFILTFIVMMVSVCALPFIGYFITKTNGRHTNTGIISASAIIYNSSLSNFTHKNNFKGYNDLTYLTEYNSTLFWLFLVTCSIYGFTDGIHGLVDGSIMSFVKYNGKGKTNYSYQRMWGSIGYGIIPIITGVFLDMFKNSYISIYMPVFYIFLFLQCMLLICLFQLFKNDRYNYRNSLIQKEVEQIVMKTEEKKRQPSITYFLFRSLTKLDTIVVIWNSFLNGVAGIVQWGFIYLLMEDKMTNSTKTIMGISFVASSIIEAFIAPMIKKITSKLGGSFIGMSISLFGYSLTFFLYYFSKDGAMVFLINMIAGITYPFYLYTAQEELYKLSRKECLTLMFTLDRSIYSGLGGGVGGVVAGILYKVYGGRVMYQIFAIFYIISAFKTLLYGVYRNQWNLTNNNNDEIAIL